MFFLLLEGSIWSLLFVKATDILHERQSKGLVDIGEVNDVHFVYGTHHPYRGFALPEHYQGKYVQTDELGFRNTPGNWKSSLPKIAYFGGSTMFSTVTNQENTIPAILQKRFKTFTHLNFGVGAYGSSQELITLIEVSRTVQPIRYAVFYDGVNEIVNSIALLQTKSMRSYYNAWAPPNLNAFKHLKFLLETNGEQTRVDEKSFFEKADIMYRFPFSFSIIRAKLPITLSKVFGQNGNDDVNKLTLEEIKNLDYKNMAQRTAGLYLQNLIDIQIFAKAKELIPVFILQPTIYSTYNRTPEEEQIYKNAKQVSLDVEYIYKLVYENIRRGSAAEKYNNI